MSAFVLLLAAGLVPGDAPGAEPARTKPRLDLRGRWVGPWDNGRTPTMEFEITDGVLTAVDGGFLRGSGGMRGPSWEIRDEGGGRCCVTCSGEDALLGLYRAEGDAVAFCFLPVKSGRPASFQVKGLSRLTLRRVLPEK
jgi:hypothetical protein